MKRIHKKRKIVRRAEKGFSIGEVLISSFLLLVGITAATALIVKDMREAFDARDTIIAAQLAQEGVELVRNVRDTNTARYIYCNRYPDDGDCQPSVHKPFSSIFAVNYNSKYWVDAKIELETQDTVPADNAFDLKRGGLPSPAYQLYKDNITGEFTHDSLDDVNNGNEKTHFRRRILMSPTNLSTSDTGDDVVVVYSLVTWNGKEPYSAIPDIDKCTTANKCAFAKDTLTGWLTIE